MATIFISYRERQWEQISPLRDALERAGHAVFFAHHDLHGGDHLLTLYSHIRDAQYFVVCSPAPDNLSDWMKDELSKAISFKNMYKWPRLLPVWFGGSYVPLDAAADLVAADCSDTAAGANRILRAIARTEYFKPSVRVLYTSADQRLATEVCAGLGRGGFRVIAPDFLEVGDSFAHERHESLIRRDPVIVLATCQAVGNRPLYDELRLCRQKTPRCFVAHVESDAHLELWSDLELPRDGIIDDGAADSLVFRLTLLLHQVPETERTRKALDNKHGYLKAVEAACASEGPFVPPSLTRLDSFRRKVDDLGPLFRPGARSVVLGEVGLGKTTLLKWIAREYAHRASPEFEDRQSSLPVYPLIPILIRLSDVRPADLEGALTRLLASTGRVLGIDPRTLDTVDDWLGPALKRGDVVVLVDGMDTWDYGYDLAAVPRSIARLSVAHPLVRWIVTSREPSNSTKELTDVGHETWREDLGGKSSSQQSRPRFDEYEMRPLDQGSVRWLWNGLQPGTQLPAAVDSDELRTPFQVVTLAQASRHGAIEDPAFHRILLPAIESLLERRREPGEPKTRVLLHNLEYLALRAHIHGDKQFSESTALAWLHEFAKFHGGQVRTSDPTAILECLRRRGSLLREMASRNVDESELTFTLDLYRDYLAARAILKGCLPPVEAAAGGPESPWQFFEVVLRDHKQFRPWRQVIRFWLLLSDDQETAIATVMTNWTKGDTEADDSEAKQVEELSRHEIVVSAMLDGLVTDRDQERSILCSFVRLSGYALFEPTVFPEATLRRLASDRSWRSRLSECIDASNEDLKPFNEWLDRLFAETLISGGSGLTTALVTSVAPARRVAGSNISLLRRWLSWLGLRWKSFLRTHR